MNLPMLFFGVLLSSLYATVFHLWRGGGFLRLVVYLLLSWLGFWLGHMLGGQVGWTLGDLGSLHALPATLGSLIMLALGYWLGLNRQTASGR